ncbi:unnamed protein product [Lymnaea stagnalis]|uniref:Centromere protein L n=1 Tax=Lymnaea stagnalis TaxID=6523 RepID=A0AAV2I6T6_LYMST
MAWSTPIYTPASGKFCSSTRIPRTPQSRRLIAPRDTFIRQREVTEDGYRGLLKKTWILYSLSPLYNFKTDTVSLKKYARSLDNAFSSERRPTLEESGPPEKCEFNVYEGLKFHESDNDALQIQVKEENVSGRGSTIVLTALFLCVNVDNVVPDNLSSHFRYYPVIMVTGTKSRTEVLLNWIERHFDCHSSPLTFNNADMQWMLACWCSQLEGTITMPVLLRYSVSEFCDGISTIDIRCEAPFCKELWDRLNGKEKVEADAEDVNRFVKAIESHHEYAMKILFSKLNLSEVGTSVAYVSKMGKLKLFSSENIYMALSFVCVAAQNRFQQLARH